MKKNTKDRIYILGDAMHKQSTLESVSDINGQLG